MLAKLRFSSLRKVSRIEQGVNSRAGFSPRVQREVYIPEAGLGEDTI